MLGLCLVILTSATTVSVMTIKPATPKHVVVFTRSSSTDEPAIILKYSKKGYIVKVAENIVVMEKY